MQSKRITAALDFVSGKLSVSADHTQSMNRVGIDARIQKSFVLPIVIKGITINNDPAKYQLRLGLFLSFKTHQRIIPSKRMKIAYMSHLMAGIGTADSCEACILEIK